MGSILAILMFLFVNALSSYGENSLVQLNFPACPPGSQKIFVPNPTKPLWIACRDPQSLYQGHLVQLSMQGEVLRISGMKNSRRHGKEIRFGASGFLEERGYLNGHLSQDSFIFKSDSVLGRILPGSLTEKDWQAIDDAASPSLLRVWLKKEPDSIVHFQDGRMDRIRFGKKDYAFDISPEGRMMAKNHPEMKGLFFIDPMPIWNLSSDDLKKAILPGFGSCKKYSGPISRFGRHYDHLLYVRQMSEAKHLANLAEIRKRFIDFCVPQDLMQHLGVLECPPQLPKMLMPNPCLVPVSDRLKIPYQPKYFKFDLSLGKSPEEFVQIFGAEKLGAFLSDPDSHFISLFIAPKTLVVVKKTEKQIQYRIFPDHAATTKVQGKDLEDKNWWEWHPFPGSE